MQLLLVLLFGLSQCICHGQEPNPVGLLREGVVIAYKLIVVFFVLLLFVVVLDQLIVFVLVREFLLLLQVPQILLPLEIAQ